MRYWQYKHLIGMGGGTAHVDLSPSLAQVSIIKPHSIADPKRRLVEFYRIANIDEAEYDLVENESF